MYFSKIRFSEKVTEHFVLGVDSDLEQNDGFRRFRGFGAKWSLCRGKITRSLTPKTNFGKMKFLVILLLVVVKLVHKGITKLDPEKAGLVENNTNKV